ncbi:MAG TPA: hypothetical protein VGO52_17590 [Hyphomonadaceae bacterium]|jgi:hypothetical protein|nr:hypothetical protein [Hyphomonadaceae bacterium]
MRSKIIALVMLALACGAPAQAQQAVVTNDQLVEGAALGNKLLVRTARRELFEADLTSDQQKRLFDSNVVDILRDGDRILILRHAPPSAAELMEYRGGEPKTIATLDLSADEKSVGLLLTSGGPGILASKSLRVWQDGAWTAKPVHGDFGWTSSAITADGKAIYTGQNNGEWGGGLYRIDLKTGESKKIERVDDPKEICGYPLDADCDPVPAMVADPERPDCVYAGVALQHMSSHGRILRVCGETVEVVFEKKAYPGGRSRESAAIYGLDISGKTLWAVSSGALYRIEGSQQTEIKLPKLEQTAGLSMARLPGMLVLSTGANQAFSLSGYTTLLVRLD